VKSDFKWLIDWFYSQCDGDWEHEYGIILETTADPGWSLSISISETELEKQHFIEQKKYVHKDDWFHCYVEAGELKGFCGIHDLQVLLHVFRKWSDIRVEKFNTDKDLDWLINWYDNCVSTHLSSAKRVHIGTLDNPGWNLYVDLMGTGFETALFEYVKVERSEHDWYHCFIRENTFHGPCGPFNLFEVIKEFKDFVESRKGLIQFSRF
jgi:hypothetical protein